MLFNIHGHALAPCLALPFPRQVRTWLCTRHANCHKHSSTGFNKPVIIENLNDKKSMAQILTDSSRPVAKHRRRMSKDSWLLMTSQCTTNCIIPVSGSYGIRAKKFADDPFLSPLYSYRIKSPALACNSNLQHRQRGLKDYLGAFVVQKPETSTTTKDKAKFDLICDFDPGQNN